jgi:hypothetical protein
MTGTLLNTAKKDALTYDNLPQYIVKHPDYKHYKNEQQSDWEANRRKQLIEFLSPAKKHEVYSTWLLC